MRISECWGRDGIQAEQPVGTESKLAVLDAAGAYGAARVEVTSFARPEVWPQFADSPEVVERFQRHPGVDYVVYVPNLRGYQRFASLPGARERVDSVLVAVAATDSYNLKNTRRDTAAALAELAQVIGAATRGGFRVIGCVGTAWCCPVDGPVAPERVLELAESLLRAGAVEVMLGDTTGEANPRSATHLVERVRGEFALPVIGHFHDMRGTALANAFAACDAGVDWIDCALGGIGGHPPDEHQAASAGNLCSEDFATVATASGILGGIDHDAMMRAGRLAEQALGRPLLSRVQRAQVAAATEAG
ncbi:MAG TPA: hydroxymethylglutaryl-CoA lyase [Candidatus Dormibacteraeota bacterium]|nr:hydroxymethylglutaryl-CoA lyase [Candidatus Dormibacteraeota bacterium]